MGSGKIITVFGPQSGVGKTTVATNLAVALAQSTESEVCLVDNDPRLAEKTLMMDTVVEHSIIDVAGDINKLDGKSIKDRLVRHPSGLSILPAPTLSWVWRNLYHQRLDDVLGLLAKGHNFIIVDTPTGFNKVVSEFLRLSDLILFITIMNFDGVRSSALWLEMLRQSEVEDSKIRLVANHVIPANGFHKEDAQRILELRISWNLPHDYNVAGNQGGVMPLVVAKPYARFSIAVRDIAFDLVGEKRETKGFLDRFRGRGV